MPSVPDSISQRDGKPAVGITGIGVATCLGADAESTWRAILTTRDGMAPMTEIESPLPSGSLGGQCVPLPANYRPDLPREARYLRWTVEHALNAANLDHQSPYQPSRRVVSLGTTLHGIRAGGRFLRTGDPAQLTTFLAGATANRALEGLGLHGGATTTCSACSSSLGAIVLGITLLQTYQADVVVAGGYDAVSEYAWAGFNALRLIAEGPLRPFCRDRQGMKIAEGYGIVILERATDAVRRGAPIAAVLAGCGESADAHHLTKPHPEGRGALAAMRQAINQAGIQPHDLGMIAAHATGTPDNDAAEYQAISGLLASELPRIPVVAFKSLLGHTLGGAGAVELILSTLALRDQIVPACANVATEDIEYSDLNLTARSPRPRDINSTLNTSLGFGGANTCVVLTRPGDSRPHIQGTLEHPAPEVWITGIGILLPGAIGPGAFLQRAHLSNNSELHCPPPPIADPDLATLLHAQRVRRFSPYVKYTLAAAGLAVRDACLSDHPEELVLASAVLGTMHGSPSFCCEYYTQIVRDGARAANPVLFAEGVPNAAAAHLSTSLGIRGSCQTIIGTRTAGLDALALAALCIRAGLARTVLVVAAEEQHPILDHVYRALRLQTSAEDKSLSHGFQSSYGAIAFTLEASTSAAARGIVPYAAVGASASASQGTSGVVRAVASVLKRTGRLANVIGSGCGTWIDRAESLGLRRAGISAQKQPPSQPFGELFAATPFAEIARTLAAPDRPSQFVSLCTDWTGATTAVTITPLSRRIE